MSLIRCDFCGGKIVARLSGVYKCRRCGRKYDKERIHELLSQVHPDLFPHQDDGEDASVGPDPHPKRSGILILLILLACAVAVVGVWLLKPV